MKGQFRKVTMKRGLGHEWRVIKHKSDGAIYAI